ncbi:MAG: hypothetical protein K2X80_05180, partial [Pseudomonadaceae bacterium]|nr:hypothetical protein [Pseudomonadaceae bacterium]
ASAYDSFIAGVPITVPADPPGLIVADSVMEFIDSHILRSSDDALGYYIAVSSPTQNWTGATVELSTDGGANWIDSDGTEANAIMGTLSAGIPAHAEEYPDMSSVLRVTLLRADMELISATQAEMQNRANLAIIGDELINFSGVNQITATTWELTGLLRGRKGSAAVAHTAGERFVLLDRNQLSFIEAELFELGRSLTFRAISYGLTTGANKTVTFTGVSQKERAPAYLSAPKISTNLIVSWQGVGRLGGGTSVGMGKYFTGYRVTLNGTTWDTTAQTLTIPYAAGTLSVQQNNSITGLGPAATVTV